MKRVSTLAIAFLSAALAQVGVAQSAGSPVNTDSSSQTKKDQKAKAKEKPPIKASTGKKTTSSQDAAYALAYKKGSPEASKNTPPK